MIQNVAEPMQLLEKNKDNLEQLKTIIQTLYPDDYKNNGYWQQFKDDAEGASTNIEELREQLVELEE